MNRSYNLPTQYNQDSFTYLAYYYYYDSIVFTTSSTPNLESKQQYLSPCPSPNVTSATCPFLCSSNLCLNRVSLRSSPALDITSMSQSFRLAPSFTLYFSITWPLWKFRFLRISHTYQSIYRSLYTYLGVETGQLPSLLERAEWPLSF